MKFFTDKKSHRCILSLPYTDTFMHIQRLFEVLLYIEVTTFISTGEKNHDVKAEKTHMFRFAIMLML
jgi:hypothetical protein